MENKKIKSAEEIDFAILNFIRQMVKSGYKVEFNRFEAEDVFNFKLRVANNIHPTIASIWSDTRGYLYLNVDDMSWKLDEMNDLTFAVTSCVSLMNELEKLFKYYEDEAN